MRQLLKVLKATGEESRLRILNILRARPLCVCEIADVLGLAQSTVSRHLKTLEDCGLLERSKDGLWVEYRLASPDEDSVQASVMAMVEREAAAGATARADAAKAKSADRNVILEKA